VDQTAKGVGMDTVRHYSMLIDGYKQLLGTPPA
jgi:hypothetical protein